MGQQITDYFFYRWRYILGYGLIVVSIIALFLLAGFLIPGGLTHAEMSSAVTSRAISFSPSTFEAGGVINFPYHLLQRASMWAFGVNQFSIKLPSLVLGALSTLGVLLLLRTWFKQNVAVLTTILAIATGQFLYLAQSGTPGIVYIFTSVWLLYAAMMVSRRARFSSTWKMILFALAAISLYTPLSIYVLVALTSAILLHPHLRFIVRQLSKLKVFFGTLFLLVIIAPLLYAVVRHPEIGLQLLGIPTHMPDLSANAVQLFHQYFNFLAPGRGGTLPMSPIYDLGSVLLILLGLYRLFTTKYTARSYIISIWAVLLIPVLIFNPQYTSVTFVPVLLLLATGVNLLLSYWYSIFPRNPYARIAGLIPLVILIGGIVFSGVDRYMYGYQYDPEIRANFSNDLALLNEQLHIAQGPVTLVINPDENAFYQLVAEKHPDMTLTEAPSTNSGTTIVSRAAFRRIKPGGMPYRIVTNGQNDHADRFYIYKTTVK